MSDQDIGPGDVVEALAHTDATSEAILGYSIAKGDRAIVARVSRAPNPCPVCGLHEVLYFDRLPTPRPFSICGWRKIGGSLTDTVRTFSEDLTPAKTREPA